jgi:hypothetical protein
MNLRDVRGGGQRLLFAAAACGAVVLVVFAAGTAAGRWRFVTPETKSPNVPLARSSLVVVVPVPAATLRTGDVVFVRPRQGPSALIRIERVTDASGHKFEASDAHGSGPVVLHDTAWRSTRVVPVAGLFFRMLAAWLPTLVLFVLGVALVVWDCLRHRRRASVPALLEESHPADLDADVIPASVTLGLLAGSRADAEPAPTEPPAAV